MNKENPNKKKLDVAVQEAVNLPRWVWQGIEGMSKAADNLQTLYELRTEKHSFNFLENESPDQEQD